MTDRHLTLKEATEPSRFYQGVALSSATDVWSTPQDLFDSCNAVFGFTLNACALPDNAKCAAYFTPEQDGLKQEWTGTVWMNPPYGRTIGQWMRKAWESSRRGATVVCLVPARTDTAWWRDYATKGKIIFWPGRLKFGGSKNSAPFVSALVVFGDAKRTLIVTHCEVCDAQFIAEGSSAKMCSGKCRMVRHREKKRAA
jgi:phage N-6-adenine-methyltransferase